MNIRTYALNLLKRRPYFIGEMYQKLLQKYERKEVVNLIKSLITEDYLNDKKLLKIKLDYMIFNKMYGKNYILDYFSRKSISKKLVMLELKNYSKEVFINNMNTIKMRLAKKGKNDNYVISYLLRKGYEVE